MGLVWMGKFYKNTIGQLVKSQRGQSAVEYILLLAVVASVAFAVLNSDLFKKLIGENSSVFKTAKSYMEYSYRHGLAGFESSDSYMKGGTHETYYTNENTRFFIVESME